MAGRWTRSAWQTRVDAVAERPDLWQRFPGGRFDARDYRTRGGIRDAWIAIVEFLQARGLVSPSTLPIDVNVPKMVEACRRQASRTEAR